MAATTRAGRKRKPQMPPLGSGPSGVPARGDTYTAADGTPTWSRPPFPPGHTYAQSHGAGETDRYNNPTNAVIAVSHDLETELRAKLGDDIPPQLLMPQFGPAVTAWLRVEARTILLSMWLDTMTREEWVTPVGGAMKAPYEMWLASESAAMKHRKALGLDPASWAGIRKDLGLAYQAEENALATLSAKGFQIRQEREAKLRAIPGGETQ